MYAEVQAASSAGTRSSLAEWLIEQWAFGFLYASQVQQIAAVAEDDHMDDEASRSPTDLQSLANLGTKGEALQLCTCGFDKIA